MINLLLTSFALILSTQNLSLLNDGLPFLSLSASRAETEIKARYKDAMLDYYEKGDTKPYAEFFISEYASTLENIHAITQLTTSATSTINHTKVKHDEI